jgi:hypothetical protein
MQQGGTSSNQEGRTSLLGRSGRLDLGGSGRSVDRQSRGRQEQRGAWCGNEQTDRTDIVGLARASRRAPQKGDAKQMRA